MQPVFAAIVFAKTSVYNDRRDVSTNAHLTLPKQASNAILKGILLALQGGD